MLLVSRGVNVIVSVNVPAVSVASDTNGAVSDAWLGNGPTPPNPVSVNAPGPLLAKVPINRSDPALPVLTIARRTVTGPVPCWTVPRSSV